MEVQKNIKLHTEAAGWLVHPDLRQRMLADADARGTTMGDLVCQILAQAFSVPYVPLQRRSSPGLIHRDQLNFKMPSDLERVVGSVYPGKKMADGIRYTLCRFYGLSVPPKRPMTRRRTARAAA